MQTDIFAICKVLQYHFLADVQFWLYDKQRQWNGLPIVCWQWITARVSHVLMPADQDQKAWIHIELLVIDWNLYHLENERSVTRDGIVPCLIASWLGKALLASSLGNYRHQLINAHGMTNTACFDPMNNQRLVQVLPWQLGTVVGGWHHEGFFLFAVFGLITF